MKSVFKIAVSFYSLIIFACHGQTNQVVSPSGYNQTPGNTGIPALTGPRVTQQLYRGSSLSPILPSPVVITGIAFRTPEASFRGFDATISSVELRMSTTSRTPETMAIDYAQNKGIDETIVFQHSNVSLFSGVASPVNPFDLRFNFDSPFLYDPKAGSLLLYMNVGSNGGGFNSLEGQGFLTLESAAGALVDGSGPFASGPAGAEIITRFSYVTVPEPKVLSLVSIAVGLFAFNRARFSYLKGRGRTITINV